jgi:hypothetical protein
VTLFADQSREQLRGAYREVWRKWRERLPLQPLEAQIADVIRAHPEYHGQLQDEASLQQEFGPGSGRENPFLHLGLHLALREQIGTDRPAGIAVIHHRLAALASSAHEAEHRMIEVLAGMLSEAQRDGQPAQDAVYLERLRRL